MEQEEKQEQAEETLNDSGLNGVDIAPGNEKIENRARPETLKESRATPLGSDESPAQGETPGMNDAPGATESAQAEESADADSLSASGEGPELERAREEIQALKDSWTRERAEFMNFKKRNAQEMTRFRGNTVADFVGGLLPVLDNLNSVLKVKTENQDVKNFVSGVEMIRRDFISVLEQNNIRMVNSSGQSFDPRFMEGIAAEDRSDLTEDTVLEVFQEGFYLEYDGGETRVLRPARVKVGKATGERSEIPSGDDGNRDGAAEAGA